MFCDAHTLSLVCKQKWIMNNISMTRKKENVWYKDNEKINYDLNIRLLAVTITNYMIAHDMITLEEKNWQQNNL